MIRSSFVRTCALVALLVAAVGVAPDMLAAQQRSTTAAFTPPASVGPVVAPVAVTRTEMASTEMHLQNPGPNNRNVIWMIVGGGMLIGGSIVGDDVGTIISVTGLVIGLVGLYRFLR